LTVTDTGSGIDEKHLDHIFEPFYSTKETGNGSGLGLSMISGFLEQSGGFIDIDTEVDTGTSIYLYFHAVDGTVSIANVRPDIDTEHKSSVVKILLVEDHVAVRDALCNLLEQDGYSVVCAACGDEALTMFNRDSAFDLLLTDMVMPGNLQGLTLAEAVREKCESLPVIFMSGYADQSIEIAENYVSLTKPVKHIDLVSAIEKSVARELDTTVG